MRSVAGALALALLLAFAAATAVAGEPAEPTDPPDGDPRPEPVGPPFQSVPIVLEPQPPGGTPQVLRPSDAAPVPIEGSLEDAAHHLGVGAATPAGPVSAGGTSGPAPGGTPVLVRPPGDDTVWVEGRPDSPVKVGDAPPLVYDADPGRLVHVVTPRSREASGAPTGPALDHGVATPADARPFEGIDAPLALGDQAGGAGRDDGHLALAGAGGDEETQDPVAPETLSSPPYAADHRSHAPVAPPGTLAGAGPGPAPDAPQAQAAAPMHSPYLASAVAAAAAAILWQFISFFAPLLTARRKDPMAHEARRALLEAVAGHPGEHIRQLATRTGLASGQARHHLRVLAAAGKVVSLKVGGFVCFFPDEDSAATFAPAAAVLRSPRARRFLRRVDVQPGCTVAQAERADGIPRGGLHYHATRMADAGLITMEVHGRERVLDVTSSGRAVAEMLRGCDDGKGVAGPAPGPSGETC